MTTPRRTPPSQHPSGAWRTPAVLPRRQVRRQGGGEAAQPVLGHELEAGGGGHREQRGVDPGWTGPGSQAPVPIILSSPGGFDSVPNFERWVQRAHPPRGAQPSGAWV